jgi:hypothetical protein
MFERYRRPNDQTINRTDQAQNRPEISGVGYYPISQALSTGSGEHDQRDAGGKRTFRDMVDDARRVILAE